MPLKITPADPAVSRPPPQKVPTGNYTQVNILFPSEQVELPPAEKFNAFPAEAQRAILSAFDREGIARHEWLKTQQKNEHEFNMQGGRHFFIWRMSGAIMGGILAITFLIGSIILVKSGASVIGIAMMLTAMAGIVGTAIYGHKVAIQQAPQKPKAEPSENETPAKPS